MNWSVSVVYPAELYFESDLEDTIHMEAGVVCDGAGMGFGERDVVFSYDSKEEAEQVAHRIELLDPSITVELFEMEIA